MRYIIHYASVIGNSYKKRFDATENCLTLDFTEGKKAMLFGGVESVISRIVQNKGLAVEKIKERRDSIFEKYGSPQHTVPGEYEKYAWGDGDGKDISTYSFFIEVKPPINYRMRNGYLSVVEEKITLK